MGGGVSVRGYLNRKRVGLVGELVEVNELLDGAKELLQQRTLKVGVAQGVVQLVHVRFGVQLAPFQFATQEHEQHGGETDVVEEAARGEFLPAGLLRLLIHHVHVHLVGMLREAQQGGRVVHEVVAEQSVGAANVQDDAAHIAQSAKVLSMLVGQLPALCDVVEEIVGCHAAVQRRGHMVHHGHHAPRHGW